MVEQFLDIDNDIDNDIEVFFGEIDKKPLFFKRVFDKKVEKVIAPVFYRMQKAYENKRPKTEISYSVCGGAVYFGLKTGKYQRIQRESRLEIIHPGFAKVSIRVIHAGLDSPENSEIIAVLPQVTQKYLTDIVERFIEGFRSKL